MVFLEPARSTLEETKDIFKGITPEWAWGGSTGKDVKVGIVDSGIDYPSGTHRMC